MTHEIQAVRTLIVDDYEPFRQHLNSQLESVASLQVIAQASDGLEAIQKAKELQPDLILLDLSLPKMNGLEAAKQIRKLAPLAKIVFVSQEFSFEFVEEALRLGASGYVHKFRVTSDLLPAIESALRDKYSVSGVVRGSFGYASIDKPTIRHEIQLCSDDATCIQYFTDFTSSSIEAGKAVIVIASESHRPGILKSLNAKNWDVDGAIKQELVLPLDSADSLSSLMLKDSLDPAHFLTLPERLSKGRRKQQRESGVPVSQSVENVHPPCLRIAIWGRFCGSNSFGVYLLILPCWTSCASTPPHNLRMTAIFSTGFVQNIRMSAISRRARVEVTAHCTK